MNHQYVIGKVEPDDLNQVPSRVRTDDQQLRRVSVRVEINDNDGVVDDMTDSRLAEAMLER